MIRVSPLSVKALAIMVRTGPDGAGKQMNTCRRMEIIMALSLIGGGLLSGGTAAAGSLSSGDAGLQLQQAQQSRERERIEKELAEQREKKPDVVENRQNAPEGQQGALRFVLQKVTVDSSAVLPDAERERIVPPSESSQALTFSWCWPSMKTLELSRAMPAST